MLLAGDIGGTGTAPGSGGIGNFHRRVRMGRRASSVFRAAHSAREGVLSVGLDLSDDATRVSSRIVTEYGAGTISAPDVAETGLAEITRQTGTKTPGRRTSVTERDGHKSRGSCRQ